ncbi:unnamed protein product [Lactuca saligna]|uniref:Uncharacterized protein n=1 Tax=Lactuca saligna TaxID=75948 RepID=A0AA35ZUT2_LACSI|nr:unnamed protein product [Lactuca saligna]
MSSGGEFEFHVLILTSSFGLGVDSGDLQRFWHLVPSTSSIPLRSLKLKLELRRSLPLVLLVKVMGKGIMPFAVGECLVVQAVLVIILIIIKWSFTYKLLPFTLH